MSAPATRPLTFGRLEPGTAFWEDRGEEEGGREGMGLWAAGPQSAKRTGYESYRVSGEM